MAVNENIKNKLKKLPKQPGVYFHKDADGKIIYIGKAAVLKNRVSSYFQNSRQRDVKTSLLVQDIADLDWITVESEAEALFLESEFIKRYKPKYNIDLRDDKHFIYIRIPVRDEWPVISYVRRPLDDGAEYFGPYTSSDPVRRAMRQLRKAFPYVTHAVSPMPKRACLHYHIGLCPGPEVGAVTPADYKRNLRRLMLYLHGKKTKLTDQLEREMQRAAKKHDFELAATRRNQLQNLQALSKQMIFSDKESFDLRKDEGLMGLADVLGLKKLPRRIECYDISHLQGTDNVASMVVFTDGVPNKEEYRRFKMRLAGNDDYAHMREVIGRRFRERSGTLRDRSLRESWSQPDLLVIDGGKGQLSAAAHVLDELGITVPAIGLAKREEEIILRDGTVIRLPFDAPALQLLQRIRDEAHRFAVTYHSLLRSRRQTTSLLDGVPGVGPATRKKLIRTFGSVAGVKEAPEAEVAKVVGERRAKAIAQYLD